MIRDLEALRAEIDRIDETLIEMISRRIEISRRIGYIKRSLGLPVRDPAREESVERRWIDLSRGKGVPEDLARSVIRTLIHYSIAIQSVGRVGEKKITLIGYGGMAKTLGEIILGAGYKISISGRDLEKARNLAKKLSCDYGEPSSVIPESDYVLLALSRSAFTEGYFDSISHLMRGKVVMDILSVKSGIYQAIENESRKQGFKYISTHPLFGPLSMPYGETIVIIPSSTGIDALDEVISFWSSVGLIPLVTSYEEHERAMAVVQVLPHIYLLALSEAIERLSRSLNVDPNPYMTYSFKRVRELIERVRSNAEAVLEIQKHNPYASEARRIGAETLVSMIGRFGDGK